MQNDKAIWTNDEPFDWLLMSHCACQWTRSSTNKSRCDLDFSRHDPNVDEETKSQIQIFINILCGTFELERSNKILLMNFNYRWSVQGLALHKTFLINQTNISMNRGIESIQICFSLNIHWTDQNLFSFVNQWIRETPIRSWQIFDEIHGYDPINKMNLT